MDNATFKLTYLSSAQLSRLPRYAQQEIERLARDLESANAKLAAGPGDSDTFADPYSHTPRPLGTGARIRFGAPDSGQAFDVQLREGELEVTAHADRQHVMAVKPRVSNGVDIAFVERLVSG